MEHSECKNRRPELLSRIVRNNWTISVALNIVILLAAIFYSDIKYDTNDDYTISAYIQSGYVHVGYVNIFLCKALGIIQNVFPDVNVFIVSQMLFSVISFVVILWFLMEKKQGIVFNVCSMAVIAIFSVDHYCSVQFTKTSALLILAGALMLMDFLIKKHRRVFLMAAIMLLYIGIWLREQNLFVVLVFLVPYAILSGWNRKKNYIGRLSFFAKRIILVIVILGVGLVTNAVSDTLNNSTPALQKYNEYNSYRSAVLDYPIADYDDYIEEYNKIGVCEKDLEVMRRWYLDYNGAATLQNLKAISDLAQNVDEHDAQNNIIIKFVKDIGHGIKQLSPRGIHILIAIVIAIIYFICFKPRYLRHVICIGFCAIILYLYLEYVGRPLYRASYGIDLTTCIMLLHLFEKEYYKPVFLNSDKLYMKISKRCAALVLNIAIIMITWILMIHSLYIPKTYVDNENEMELYKYMNNNTNSFFVFSSKARQKYVEKTPEYLNPLITKKQNSYNENVATFGGWSTFSPIMFEKLSLYGINNVFSDIIDNDNVYVIEMPESVADMEAYFNRWYGQKKSIKYIHVKKIGGYDMYQVKSY